MSAAALANVQGHDDVDEPARAEWLDGTLDLALACVDALERQRDGLHVALSNLRVDLAIARAERDEARQRVAHLEQERDAALQQTECLSDSNRFLVRQLMFLTAAVLRAQAREERAA